MKHVIAIAPDFKHLEPLIEQIAGRGVPDGAELIYQARNRVYNYTYGSEKLNIKSFHCPRFINAYAYGTLRKSKARRSFEFAGRLESLGIGTPEPIAFIENYEHGKLRESYYICRQIEGENVRDWELRPDSEELIDALAADLVKIHRAGVFHKDYTPGNILFTKDAGGRYHFYYIDLNRMQFDVTSTDVLMQNFRAIHLDPAQTLRLARAYARSAGKDEKKIMKIAAEQIKAYRTEKSIHHFFKRIIGHDKRE